MLAANHHLAWGNRWKTQISLTLNLLLIHRIWKRSRSGWGRDWWYRLWKILRFGDSSDTANLKRFWKFELLQKRVQVVMENHVMSLKNVSILSLKWVRRLNLNCKFWNDIEDVFKFIVISFQEIRRSWGGGLSTKTTLKTRFSAKLYSNILPISRYFVTFRFFNVFLQLKQIEVYILIICCHSRNTKPFALSFLRC